MKTCERGRVKDFEQWSRVYNAVRYNAFFPVDPYDRIIMELQCISFLLGESCILHSYRNEINAV